jgi:peptidase S11 D-alanyl-D-alanine carboxypeptidase 1
MTKSQARLAKHAEKFSRSAKRVVKSRFPHRTLAQAAEQWQVSQHLAVNSASALVFDQKTGNALFQKNASEITPIASITKLMTAMVVLDSAPDLQAMISIGEDDIDSLRGSRSRLPVGLSISRETALLLALMSSENRAAHALARHYPGGMPAFITAMNAKANALGMYNTRFDDPTGLSSANVSTAHDLARMVAAAYRYPLIRAWSTTAEASVDISGQSLTFRNTNPLVSHSDWAVGLSKTGYIHEAGRCLVMQAWLTDKPVVIVLLDSAGKLTRVGDANRIKRWMEYTQQRDTARALAASGNAS